MASIAQLREIAGRYTQRQPRNDTGLMQHATSRQNHEVEISERTGSNIYTGRGSNRSGPRNNTRRERMETNQQVVTEQHPEQSEAMGKQTQVLKSQSGTLNRQTGILDQQTGLMHDQIQATQQVADIVKRLAEYMEKQASKPEPKIQQYSRPGGRQGNVYEGEFTRVPNAADQRRRSIMDELREKRRQRARAQPRDERGRFKQAKKLAPKIQELGGSRLSGLGGRLGGLAMRGAIPLAALGVAFYGGKVMNALRDNYEYDKNSAGTIAHGWQSAKDKVGDWAGAGEKKQLLVRDGNSEQQTNRIANRASNGPLGSVSEAFESGGRGVGTISTGKGDKGGVSYGSHQLSTNSGSMSAFLRSEEGSKFYGDFRGLAPGSKEFNDKYAEVAKTKGADFEAAQSSYIRKTNYDPVAGWFAKQFGIDPEKRSKALREMLYSVGVQYGFKGARQLISEALGNRDPSKMSDKDLINYIQNYRYGSAPDKFRSSSSDVISSVQTRAANERDVLLKMADDEQSGANNTNMGGQGQSVLLRQPGGSASGGKTIMQTAAQSFQPAAGGGGNSDEAGGGTFASPTGGSGPQANGNFYNLGIKHTIPKDNSVNLAGLNDKFKQAWYTMVGDWVTNAKGGNVTVASAFRSRAEQEQLWVKYGRNTKRVARPGTSRHESGFAIDIDRTSAQSMESSGMFKKYGFHRPLANEPWHVELIGAGKQSSGAASGDVATQPMTMQAAAVQEMNKAAETTVNQAEENTKTAVEKQPGTTAATPTDSETKPNAAVDAGAKQAENATKADAQKAGEGTGAPASASDVTTAPVNQPGVTPVPNGTNGRTPQEQALYEQYLKSAGGDARKVPDSVTTGMSKVVTNAGGTPTGVFDVYNNRTAAPGTGIPAQSPINGLGNLAGLAPGQSPVPKGNGGAGTGTNGVYTQGTQQPGMMDSLSKVFDVRTPMGGSNPYSGTLYGSGNDDVAKGIRMARSVDPRGTNAVTGGIGSVLNTVGAGMAIGKSDNKVDAVLRSGALPGVSREMGTFNSAVRQWDYNPVAAIQTMQQSNIVKAASSGLSSLFGLDGPKAPDAPSNAPTMVRGAPVLSTADINKSVPVTSAASPSYYKNDTPVISKPASGPTATMAPVTSQIAAAPVERNSFDAVQTVRVADAAPANPAPVAAGSSGGGGGQSTAGGNGSKADAVQLDEVPAIIDDFGLLFINAGFS